MLVSPPTWCAALTASSPRLRSLDGSLKLTNPSRLAPARARYRQSFVSALSPPAPARDRRSDSSPYRPGVLPDSQLRAPEAPPRLHRGPVRLPLYVTLCRTTGGLASPLSPIFGSVPWTRLLMFGMCVSSTIAVANAPNIVFDHVYTSPPGSIASNTNARAPSGTVTMDITDM